MLFLAHSALARRKVGGTDHIHCDFDGLIRSDARVAAQRVAGCRVNNESQNGTCPFRSTHTPQPERDSRLRSLGSPPLSHPRSRQEVGRCGNQTRAMHNDTWIKWVARFYHHGHFKSCRETIVLQKLRAESFREASSMYQYGCQVGI